MASLNGFDATTVDPNKAFEPLPAGDYIAAIVDSENKPTKNGTGSYLELKMQVLEGEHKGRFVFDRLNLDNPNAQAVQIARGTLSAICHAVNVMRPNDSVELHNLPMMVKVACRKRQDTGDISNEVKGYQPRNSQATQKQTAAASGGSAPWSR